jgi:hypothetical protein
MLQSFRLNAEVNTTSTECATNSTQTGGHHVFTNAALTEHASATEKPGVGWTLSMQA